MGLVLLDGGHAIADDKLAIVSVDITTSDGKSIIGGTVNPGAMLKYVVTVKTGQDVGQSFVQFTGKSLDADGGQFGHSFNPAAVGSETKAWDGLGAGIAKAAPAGPATVDVTLVASPGGMAYDSKSVSFTVETPTNLGSQDQACAAEKANTQASSATPTWRLHRVRCPGKPITPGQPVRPIPVSMSG